LGDTSFLSRRSYPQLEEANDGYSAYWREEWGELGKAEKSDRVSAGLKAGLDALYGCRISWSCFI
jgi:hypothetical protein